MIYKVLIVEDEAPILNNIVQKVNNLQLPVTVMATACDGEEALEVIAHEQPHIVLTDIRMPGMDGLALCDRLDRQYPQIKKVILSGYGEFEYAQKSIQSHVIDYLLKPVNLAQLEEVMQKLCATLQQENTAQEQQFLTQHLAGGNSTLPLPCQFSDKKFGIYLICLGNLLERTCVDTDFSFFAALWHQVDLDGFLKNQSTACGAWWSIAEKYPNEHILVTSCFEKGFETALQKHLTTRLSVYVHTTVCACEKGVSFKDIWKSAQQLRHLLHSCLVPCVSNVFTPSTAPVFSEVQIEAVSQLVLRAVRNRQRNAFESMLENYLSSLKNQQISQQMLESNLSMLIKKMAEHSDTCETLSKSTCSQILQLIAEQKNVDALYQMLYHQLFDLYATLFPTCESGEELAHMVQKYLAENYREEISVETLSEVFHFSASYIGRVFRTQFGVPPVKYLLQLRMEKAKQLIHKNSDVNLALISEMVGFSDPHYFSRIFRATVGITPSEYKRQVAKTSADSLEVANQL